MDPELHFLQDNHFNHDSIPLWSEIPPQDEPFVEAWKDYIQEISRKDSVAVLSQYLVQLQFPVQEGMSTNPEYLGATRKGMDTSTMKTATGCLLENPAGLKVYLYQTMAGNIPVLETCNRKDFETLVQVFSYRNEPVPIPASMGACMIKGYNNWDRVGRYRHEMGTSFSFQQMKAHKEEYQDSFLILTDNYYSGVAPELAGFSEEKWRQLSMIIRKEHEAAHYFTLRVLGSAKNDLLDEFIADYMGIVAALGRFEAKLFLTFLGLENYPVFRSDGRLLNYLKNRAVSEGAFRELQSCIWKAAKQVEEFANSNPAVYSEEGKYQMFLSLTKSNLVELASSNAVNRLAFLFDSF